MSERKEPKRNILDDVDEILRLLATGEKAEPGRWRANRFNKYDKRIFVRATKHPDDPWSIIIDNDDTTYGPANTRFVCRAANARAALRNVMANYASMAQELVELRRFVEQRRNS